jgi:predicted PurR-regulated permease PerM
MSGTPARSHAHDAARASSQRKVREARIGDHEHVGRISTQTTIFVLIVVALILYEIQWILPPFVIAGVLAYIASPTIDWASARSGLPRGFFALLVFVLVLLVAVMIGYLGIPPLARETTHLFSDFEAITRALAQRLIGSGKVSMFGQPMDANQLADAAANGIRNWVVQTSILTRLGAAIFATMFGMILTLVLLFYFLWSGPSLAQGMLRLVPPDQRPLIMHIWTVLDPVLKRYFIGVLVVVAYAAAAAYVGLGLVLGIPHAVLLALLTGVLEMIPVIGPAAAAVIAGLVAVHSAAGIGAIIAYALYATALRISIDQLFGPLALGTAARLHPVLVIFCFLSGGFLFGVVGVIMAIPVALVVKITLTLLYDEPPSQALASK